MVATAAPASAQSIRGRVLDSERGDPVPLAGVFLLDRDRGPLVSALADSVGRYTLEAPGAGEYILYVQRLGYFETESPLLAVSAGGSYALDFEMRPEPIRLDPLLVAVRNEELERFWTLKLGVNPNSVFGYRAIQGVRLAEAKLESRDNTELLRELYVPVSHAERVCIGRFGLGLPSRPPASLRGGTESRSRPGQRECGSLFIDDLPVPNEHLESIDKRSIAVVVVLGGNVHLYTRQFDWTMRPGSR